MGGMKPLNPARVVPVEVAEAIGPFYVYVLIDPRDNGIFYVGKGTGARMAAHGRQADLEPDAGESTKLRRIHDIRASGLEPHTDVVVHQIDTEDEAFRIEAALIACLPNLTNLASGHGAGTGRTPLDNLISTYGAPPLTTDATEAALLIRLTNRWTTKHEELEPGTFRAGTGWYPRITSVELYDATRGWWKVSQRTISRRNVSHAVAVVDGITRAVYRTDQWIGPRPDGRFAFNGEQLTSGTVFDSYVGPIGRRAPFAAHSQNPLIYWPPTSSASRQ
jgi:hypothetical protein